MKRLALSLILITALCRPLGYSWGFYAHEKINRLAIFTLPPQMFGFYKASVGFLEEHAVDPDKRRYATKDEAPRHYIDIDHYGAYPFDGLPRKWDSAVAKYGEDTLKAYGIVPWHIQRMYYRLVKAFEEQDTEKILRYSAELGHYVGDACVPLHTTENYNGQLSDQKGIHGFWESRLPELFAKDYDLVVGQAGYLESPLEEAWRNVLSSHRALDSVLTMEKSLSERFSEPKYQYEERGASLVRSYSRAYSKAYHDMLDGMVERRMRRAILSIGSFWLSAWVDAGQPDLDKYIDPIVLERIKRQQQVLPSNGSWQGRPE